MNKQKVFGIAAACVLLFGLIFAAVGGGLFIGFAVPEIRDTTIATNTAYPLHTAVVTREVRSSAIVNNERLYRVAFSWDDNHGQSNALYTRAQAESMVGETIMVRVNENGRAVPVNFAPSVLTTLGWVFLGVFGGIGLAAILTAGGLMFARSKIDNRWE